ncbi:MAG: KUP/HAK/KT family potassium transporter [Bacteroidota bacterium]|nr:KUP/HAK/KT family potassium transporter [Candidatus Kapabacteria bacterium]MDW8219804.1 KUP/HAK/KT family potassium transporter [Bacteroidota bacterium]
MSYRLQHQKLSLGGLLVTIGIIYGDIGTSPLYVLKAIVGVRPITEDLVLGGLSCIFWTLTLQTTVKYVLITLRADNNGEGGIFSLFTLVRRRGRWLVVPAMLGGASLIADGIITPPISVSSAIEGLRILNPALPTVGISMGIITALFVVQQFGTEKIGHAFGPIMVTWFVMLAVLGILNISAYPLVVKALNPYYAYHLLTAFPYGFWILGAVFLCTTGAEALYSDLGHCGRTNIQVSWCFVKTALILNYMGQGAWLITSGLKALDGINPFYAIMPRWFLPVGIAIATVAAIIASQALISGSFTLFSEAIKLHLWPRLAIRYPSESRGQMYIPAANWLLWAGCMFVLWYFRESSHMEAAYGIAITLAMLSTTVLLTQYLKRMEYPTAVIVAITAVFGCIELGFLIANMSKVHEGGWITLVVSAALMMVMSIWYNARIILARFAHSVRIEDYLPALRDLSDDREVPKYATHLVYLNKVPYPRQVDRSIIYSILEKQPKRADIYWILHIETTDSPYTMEYEVEHLVPNAVIRLTFYLGFRVPLHINAFFRQVVCDLEKNDEVDTSSRYISLKNNQITGDFRFVVFEEYLSDEYERLTAVQRIIVEAYIFLKRFSLSIVNEFELDLSSVTVEKVPISTHSHQYLKLRRIEA